MKSQISPSDRASLASEIAALAEAPTADLKSRWRVLYGAEPPPRISRDLLTRALAYRMHSEALPRGQDWSDTKCSNPIAGRTGCTARIEQCVCHWSGHIPAPKEDSTWALRLTLRVSGCTEKPYETAGPGYGQ
jgi:hypothetical protein